MTFGSSNGPNNMFGVHCNSVIQVLLPPLNVKHEISGLSIKGVTEVSRFDYSSHAFTFYSSHVYYVYPTKVNGKSLVYVARWAIAD